MPFVELSTINGKIVGNINLIQRVFVNQHGKTCIVGWSNNEYIEINESYEYVIQTINDNLARVNRLPKEKIP